MLTHPAPIDSPRLPVNDGIVTSPKEFSDGLTLELTDEEITRALQVVLPIRRKWQEIFRTKVRHSNFGVEEAMKLIDQFEDEIKYELATKCDLLVHVDVEPVFSGEPPVITFEGALPGHISAKYGMDHERKEWEVKRAKDRGEDFLGIEKLDE